MKHTIYADLDTIVFEGREKDYGSFEMRKKYNRILNRSALIAVLLFLSVTGLPKVISWISPNGPSNDPATEVTYIMDEIDLPPRTNEDKVEEPPLPPEVKKPLPPEPPKTVVFTVIEPSPEPDPDAIVNEMDSLLVDTVAFGKKAFDGKGTAMNDFPWEDYDPNGADGPRETVIKKVKKPSHTEFFAGEEPRPINMDDFKKRVGYPPMAREADIQGKVIVRVLVDTEGRYMEHVVLKDPHPILTKAVEKRLDDLRFTPGIQGNQPVMVWVTIPVDFQLTN